MFLKDSFGCYVEPGVAVRVRVRVRAGAAAAIWVRDGDAWEVVTKVEKWEIGDIWRGAQVPASPSVFTCRTTVP